MNGVGMGRPMSVWKHWFGLVGGGVRSYEQGQDGSRELLNTLGGDPELEQTEIRTYKGREKS